MVANRIITTNLIDAWRWHTFARNHGIALKVKSLSFFSRLFLLSCFCSFANYVAAENAHSSLCSCGHQWLWRLLDTKTDERYESSLYSFFISLCLSPFRSLSHHVSYENTKSAHRHSKKTLEQKKKSTKWNWCHSHTVFAASHSIVPWTFVLCRRWHKKACFIKTILSVLGRLTIEYLPYELALVGLCSRLYAIFLFFWLKTIIIRINEDCFLISCLAASNIIDFISLYIS